MSVGAHLEIPYQYSAHFLRLELFSTAFKSFGLIVIYLGQKFEVGIEMNYNTNYNILTKFSSGNTKMASEFEGVV